MANPGDNNSNGNVFVRTQSHNMDNIAQGHDAGQNLPNEVIRRLEGLAGQDLSGIKIHTNNRNIEAIGASAYARGNDIFFAPGKYDPNSTAGIELLAHEAAHIVQQKQNR